MLHLKSLSPLDLARFENALKRRIPVSLGEYVRHPFLDQLTPLASHVAASWHRQWLPHPAPNPQLRPTVSVVIPALQIPIGLHSLFEQDIPLEILVLANGSCPDVPEPARTLRVQWQGHGRTRQWGVEQASGEYVLFLVDDAIPIGNSFVQNMVHALEEGGYDAVFARQVPWPLADRVTRRRLTQWTPGGRGHWQVDRLDHVAALYRRATLIHDPLDNVSIAEDWWWGRRHRCGYVADTCVLHSHKRGFMSLYRRTRDTHREFARAGLPPVFSGVGAMVHALPGVVGPDFRGASGELLGQYMGYVRS